MILPQKILFSSPVPQMAPTPAGSPCEKRDWPIPRATTAWGVRWNADKGSRQSN